MPTYEYLCKQCGETFSLVLSVSEHDQLNAMLVQHQKPTISGETVQCPGCEGVDLEQQLTSFFAKTSRKS